jgi:hypoxanthine phosphoribosyltransferase
MMANLESRGAASVKLAALLDKFERRQKEVKIDYLGFKIPDEFVVGYGLDFAERYRNLPFIAVLKNPEA